MRNLAASIFILFFMQPLMAQYSPLAVEGKYWVNIRHVQQEAPFPVSAYATVISSDTLLDGQLYHKSLFGRG